MQPIHWIKEKYQSVTAEKSLSAAFKDFFQNLKPNMQKLLFRIRHLDESNENLAYFHFERGNINDAILRFKIIKRVNKRPVYNFFLGRLYWEKRKNDKAIEHINAYLASGDTEFEEEAQYCKKLASLNESEIDEVPIYIIHHNYNKFYFTFQKEFESSVNYGVSSPFFRAIEPYVTKYFGKSSAIRVLDIGCADGVLGSCCKKAINCQDIVGIELVERLARIAESRRDKDFQTYSKIIMGDFYEISKQMKDSFNLIIAENFVSYRADLNDTLARMVGFLSKGGLIALSFIETTKYEKSEFLIDEEDFAFNIEYVKRIVQNNGLKVEMEEKVEYSPNNICTVIIFSYNK